MHDVFVRRIMHESARLLVIWDNHKTLVWSEIAFVTEFHGD